MNKYEYITKHIDVIRKDIDIGIAFPSILRHLEIYNRYLDYIKKGFKKGEAAKLTAGDFKVSLHFIQRVRKDMERVFSNGAGEIKLLRKQLVKKGYSLVGNDINGYAIKDKYSKVLTKVSSLADVDRFLMDYWMIHYDRIFKKKIPPINN